MPPQTYEPVEVAPRPEHQEIIRRVTFEARAAQASLQGSRVLQVAPIVQSGEALGEVLKASLWIGGTLRTDFVQALKICARDGVYFLVVPWSGGYRLAHEFISIIPGTISTNLLMKRSMLLGTFVGSQGGAADPLAKAAEYESPLGSDIEWDQEIGRARIKLQWGLQSAACSESHTFHVMKTAERGIFTKDLGVAWYAKRRLAFWSFVAKHAGAAVPPCFAFQPQSMLFANDVLASLQGS